MGYLHLGCIDCIRCRLLWSIISHRESLVVCQSVTRSTVLTQSPDGSTSMWPLLHYCSHYIAIIQDSMLEPCCVAWWLRSLTAAGHGFKSRYVTLGDLSTYTYVPLPPSSSIICYSLNGWVVNRHKKRCTSPASVVLPCKLMYRS